MEQNVIKNNIHKGRYNMDFEGRDPYGNAEKVKEHIRKLKMDQEMYSKACK